MLGKENPTYSIFGAALARGAPPVQSPQKAGAGRLVVVRPFEGICRAKRIPLTGLGAVFFSWAHAPSRRRVARKIVCKRNHELLPISGHPKLASSQKGEGGLNLYMKANLDHSLFGISAQAQVVVLYADAAKTRARSWKYGLDPGLE